MGSHAYILLLVAIVIGANGQLLFKHGMSRRPGFRFGDVMAVARDLSVVGGFCCYAVATILYFKVLASLDLSIAYPTVSLGYVLVIVMSRVLFQEPVSATRWVAALIICTGVALVGFGSG